MFVQVVHSDTCHSCNLYEIYHALLFPTIVGAGAKDPTNPLPSTTSPNSVTTASEPVNPQQSTTMSSAGSQAITFGEPTSVSTSFVTTTFNKSPNQNVIRDLEAAKRNRYRTVIATVVPIGGLILLIVILILSVLIVIAVVKYRQQKRQLKFKIRKDQHRHIGLGNLYIPCKKISHLVSKSPFLRSQHQ